MPHRTCQTCGRPATVAVNHEWFCGHCWSARAREVADAIIVRKARIRRETRDAQPRLPEMRMRSPRHNPTPRRRP